MNFQTNKPMRNIFYVILLSFFFTNGQAQEMSPKDKDNQKRHEMIEQEKIPFFTKQLALTSDEAKLFWPLYDEYNDKKRKLMEKKHKIGKQIRKDKEKISEIDAKKINEEYFKIETDELILEKEYNEKFKKILPIQKVNQLYFVEHQFRVHLLNKLKNHPQLHPVN